MPQTQKPPDVEPEAVIRRRIARLYNQARKAAAGETAPRGERRYRMLLFQAYILLATLAFAVLALLARTVAYFSIDLWITQEFQEFGPGWFQALMQAVSWPGYPPQVVWIGLAVALALASAGFQWEGVMAGISGGGAGALNVLVKAAIQRPRPSADLVDVLQELASYSFPSGHVMLYTAFCGFLTFLSFSLLRPSWRRRLLTLFFLSLVLLVGPSRIYLGQHWASDVVAGYLLGSLWLLLSIQIYRLWKHRFSPHRADLRRGDGEG